MNNTSIGSSRAGIFQCIGQNAMITDIKVNNCSFTNVAIVIEAFLFVIIHSIFSNNVATSSTSRIVYVGNKK